MKKTIYGLAIIGLTAGTIFTSCETPGQKLNDDQANVQNAEEQLKATKQVLPQDYPAFKAVADSIINTNEKQIADIRVRMGQLPPDSSSLLKLDTLRSKNHELKDRLYGYQMAQSDWEGFKKKFNRDMDSLNVKLGNFWK